MFQQFCQRIYHLVTLMPKNIENLSKKYFESPTFAIWGSHGWYDTYWHYTIDLCLNNMAWLSQKVELQFIQPIINLLQEHSL